MKLEITQAENGYLVRVSDSIKREGVYIFRAIDYIKMLEFVGVAILDHPIRVEEK